MPVTAEILKQHQQDYLIAKWENGELVMEPVCSCGSPLDEDYFCKKCQRKCNCNFIACSDPQAFSIVEKLLQGNPNFKNFEAALLDQ